MKYPVYFHIDPETSTFGVSFPDFPGCVSAGDTFSEAFNNAKEALVFHIEGMREDGENIPKPSNFREAFKQKGDAKVMDWIELDEK